MNSSYRIISIEACDIYGQEQENGVAIGYKMPESKSDAYFRLFKIYLDNSLDLIELEKAYKRICRKKFSFQDKNENEYTLAVINLKFNYTYKSQEGNLIKMKDLREHFYENGFHLDGIHYVRYKRSAGSSREGKCLFIDDRLYRHMTKWSECGLKPRKDLASWESYRALSLSSIKGTMEIPLDSILFVPDYKSVFEEEVVSVEIEDGKLSSKRRNKRKLPTTFGTAKAFWMRVCLKTAMRTSIWCCFVTSFSSHAPSVPDCRNGSKIKILLWIDLKSRGFVTLAEDIHQIVMVTTPNSLKYLKFAGGLAEKNIRKWAAHTDSTFGVVKYDKSTRFFHGKMVQSSYQLINTLSLSQEEVKHLLQPSIDYISLLRRDIDFMRYHFTDAFAREKDGEEELL